MGLSYGKIEKVRDDFIADYWKAPFIMHSCGVSIVKEYDRNAPEPEASDYCLTVSLMVTPPKGTTLPDTYKGVRVFSHVTGMACAH